jgi:hypothetical protein
LPIIAAPNAHFYLFPRLKLAAQEFYGVSRSK